MHWLKMTFQSTMTNFYLKLHIANPIDQWSKSQSRSERIEVISPSAVRSEPSNGDLGVLLFIWKRRWKRFPISLGLKIELPTVFISVFKCELKPIPNFFVSTEAYTFGTKSIATFRQGSLPEFQECRGFFSNAKTCAHLQPTSGWFLYHHWFNCQRTWAGLEPGTMLLLASGLAGLVGGACRVDKEA